jgi:hypothetical protein
VADDHVHWGVDAGDAAIIHQAAREPMADNEPCDLPVPQEDIFFGEDARQLG